MFLRNDLDELLACEARPAVSIFLPTHKAGREIRQDSIRLRNLLGTAAQRLGADRRSPAVEALLEPARRLVEEHNLLADPEFNPALRPPEEPGVIAQQVQRLTRWLSNSVLSTTGLAMPSPTDSTWPVSATLASVSNAAICFFRISEISAGRISISGGSLHGVLQSLQAGFK